VNEPNNQFNSALKSMTTSNGSKNKKKGYDFKGFQPLKGYRFVQKKMVSLPSWGRSGFDRIAEIPDACRGAVAS